MKEKIIIFLYQPIGQFIRGSPAAEMTMNDRTATLSNFMFQMIAAITQHARNTMKQIKQGDRPHRLKNNNIQLTSSSEMQSLSFLLPTRNQRVCSGQQRGVVERVQTGHSSCGGNPLKQKHICMLLLYWALPCHGSLAPRPARKFPLRTKVFVVRYPPSPTSGGSH